MDAQQLQTTLAIPVRGTLRQGADLSKTTWFRVGGRADILFRPADVDDLSRFLKALPAEIPVTVLGVGSNVIIRDGGIRGVVIRLGRGFNTATDDNNNITAGAAMPDQQLANYAAQASITGLEFLIGIPGTIGGAVKMNAGAYGREMKDIVQKVQIVHRDGTIEWLPAAALNLTYRHSTLPEGAIVTAAIMEGEKGKQQDILARMAEISASREASQPVRERTGGSTFANPDPATSNGKKAWQLVDEIGGRGLQHGTAQVSQKHTNFLINTDAEHGRAADLEALGEMLRSKVKEQFGITLRWEIERLGDPE